MSDQPAEPHAPIDQSGQTVFGNQTNIAGDQYIFAGTPVGAPIALDIALARLAELPANYIPDVAPLPPGSWMPLSPNPFFVGRRSELLVLAYTMQTGGAAQIVPTTAVATTGLGGIGKTQLASAFVHCYGQYFLGGVFWLSFADPSAVPSEIAQCAGWMSDLPAAVTHLPLPDQVQRVRLAWQEPIPRLLIFDNCEDPTLLETWRPKTGGCRVLITSRRAHWPSAQAVTTVTVGTLPRTESIALLEKFARTPPPISTATRSHLPHLGEGGGGAKGETTAWDRNILDAIAAELGDLPLALHMAGSYLAQVAYDVSPTTYLAQLRSPDLLDYLSLQTDDYSPTDHKLDVARTFALSFARLSDTIAVDVTARHILVCAAHFAPSEFIPRNLLRNAAELVSEEQSLLAASALRRLVNLGLLEDEFGGSLRLHRLLHHFVATTLTNELAQTLAQIEQTLIHEADRLNITGDPTLLLTWQVHLRHFTTRALHRLDERAAGLCNELGVHLYTIGDYPGAQTYFDQALAIRQAVFGEHDLATATTLNNFGNLLQDINDYTGAQRYYERALSIKRALLGERDPSLAITLNNLGTLLEDMGNYDEAFVYYEQVLAIHHAVFGEQHPTTATSLNNLGGLLEIMHNYTKARTYHEQALAIRLAVRGEQHPDTAQSLNNLGYLLQITGDYAEAQVYYERALAIYESVLGEHHRATASVLNNLGTLLRITNDYTKAQLYTERAVNVRLALLGEENPATATSFNNLGLLAHDTGDQTTAQTYLIRALIIREKTLGANHPDTQETRKNLTIVQSRFDQAQTR